MKKLIFIFGSNPQISLAELVSVIGSSVLGEVAQEYAIAEVPDETDAAVLQNRLGGVVKIGSVITEVNSGDISDQMKKFLIIERKYVFGISAYGAVRFPFKNIGMELKKKLRADGLRSRLAVSRENNLSSAAVVKNKLVSEGVEFLILTLRGKLILGKTLTVQDFEKYNLRDYGRPRPAPRSGMLPPKLAQMMINFSEVSESQTLLDPFCGSGTVLQEAAYRGIQNIIGTDKSLEAVSGSKQNLDWFQRKFNGKFFSLKIFQCDVLNLSRKISVQSIDAIVTEPYLGPPLAGRENAIELRKNRNNLETLYADAFQEFAKILKPNGVVVIIFPRFQKNGEFFEIRNLERIKKSGFVVRPLGQSGRGSVIYQKEIQHLAREIFVFKKREALCQLVW